LEITCNGITAIVPTLISSDLRNDIYIGWQDLMTLRIINPEFPTKVCAATTKKGSSATKATTIEGLFKEFNEVFHEGEVLRTMKGPPMRIHLREDIPIIPKRVLTARKPPLHFQTQAEAEVTKLVKAGVLEKVTEPTAWISPSMFVPKENGGVRLVTDFTGLNKYVQRPVHPFPTASEIVNSIPATAKWFAKVDAVKGYFQIPLDEEARSLTTTLLPSGRYRYARAPMGLSCSSDEFCSRTDMALQGLEGVQKIVDDILIHAPTEASLIDRLRQVLERCQQHGITLSKSKTEAAQEVKFAGFLVSANGVKPDPAKVAAIKDFPTPENTTDVRAFMGLANQLGQFLPDLAHATEPLRGLLKKDNAFMWLAEHQVAFDETKRILTSPMLVHHFDPEAPTELLTDASRLHGLGFALIQYGKTGELRLIQCGSRSLTDTETRYATIELECLAIMWAIQKCRLYLLGTPKPFHVVTDHKPLIGILQKKDLGDVGNARVQRLMEKVSEYNYSISWTPGKGHTIADALSRAPVFSPKGEDIIINSVTHTSFADISDDQLRKLANIAQFDNEYQLLIEAFKRGLEPRSLTPHHPARSIQSVWNELSLEDGLLCVGHRILVPKTARLDILKSIHIAHGGLQKTRQAANQLYFWPGITNQIKQMVENCERCQQSRPSQAAEPIITTEATYAMEKVSADLFHQGGKTYLVLVDRFSGFPFVKQLRSTSTDAVTATMKDWFFDWGIPASIRTDGGPQFRQQFVEFCRQMGVNHECTSPYNPRSNGHAEAAVKNMKLLLEKYNSEWSKFRAALLEWRNTPRAGCTKSPAQFMFGRRQRTQVPAHPQLLREEIPHEQLLKERPLRKDWAGKSLPPLEPGSNVRVQDPLTKRWDSTAKVVESRDTGRSYIVENYEKQFLRNRRFLKPTNSEPVKFSRQQHTLQSALDTDKENADSNSSNSSDSSRSPIMKGTNLRRSPRLAAKKQVSFQ
jgi:hypothetical protein